MPRASGPSTLRAVLRDADAELFVGRGPELRAVVELLDERGPSRILYVHGPGGIGKSALLRAAARLAEGSGFAVASFDARALHGGLDELLQQLAGPDAATRVLVLDEVDHLGSMLAPLRDALLDRLLGSARIVLAGRKEPEPSWREHGLPGIVVDLPLGPLADEHAETFLAQRGITEAQRRSRIVDWARGYPLALTVAAGVPEGGRGISAAAHLEERLLAWLAGNAMHEVDHEVLEAAAIARVLDGRLLAAALPGRSTRELLTRLRSLPVVQPLGSGISMHPVLAEAIRDRMKATAPQHYRILVRRIAEHLADRARLGDMEALVELSQLIEDEQFRRAIGNEPSRELYADRPGPEEFAQFGRSQGFERGADWAEAQAWRGAGREFVLRRAAGDPLLWVCLLPVAELPELGPIAASQRAALRRIGSHPDRTFATIAMFGAGTVAEREQAGRLASGAFMRHAGIPDVEAMLMSFPEPDRQTGPTAINSFELLDAGPRAVSVSDFRPLGAVGFVEAIVLAEQGFSSRGPGTEALLAPTDDPDREARLRAVLDEVFTGSREDRALRAVLEAAHLGPRLGEAALLEHFHVGRSTWYRMLRAARERVLAHR